MTEHLGTQIYSRSQKEGGEEDCKSVCTNTLEEQKAAVT